MLDKEQWDSLVASRAFSSYRGALRQMRQNVLDDLGRGSSIRASAEATGFKTQEMVAQAQIFENLADATWEDIAVELGIVESEE